MEEQEQTMTRREIDPRLLAGGGLSPALEALSHRIIGCAIEVHRTLGPGLLEGIYEDALAYELGRAGLQFQRQIEIVIPYKEILLRGHRLDLMVEHSVIVELKSITAVQDVHRAQLLSYLRAADKPLGLLFNFNVALLKQGIDRLINSKSPSGPALASSPTSSASRSSRSIS